MPLVAADPVLAGNAGLRARGRAACCRRPYLFTRGTTRDALRAHACARRRRAALPAIMRSARGARLFPTRMSTEAVILASIVEKESAIPAEERRHIASIFLNRLARGMKLQSDPTIIYGLTGGYPLGHDIRESELESASPYNTYVIDRLPPTPICNPGKDSLEAVLNPEPSDDLYFVADGHGGHVFAATLAQHEKNVAAWRAFERSQEGLRQQPGPVAYCPSCAAPPRLNFW